MPKKALQTENCVIGVRKRKKKQTFYEDVKYTYTTFLCCAHLNVFSNRLSNFMKIALVAFLWFFSTVCFQMFPQTTCLRRYEVTVITIVRHHSTVCLQIALPNLQNFALVAFTWLFSTVCFRMFPQTACLIRDKVTVITIVCFFLQCAF